MDGNKPSESYFSYITEINTWAYFSFPTFVNMLLGRFPEAILPFEETDADV